jgi:hypothetical protein
VIKPLAALRREFDFGMLRSELRLLLCSLSGFASFYVLTAFAEQK